MKTRRAVAGAATIALIVGGAVSLAGLALAADNTAARCIKVSAEARYRGLGYNHIVHVTDICAVAAECDVSTDVNPQPTHVTVHAGEHIEVPTFMGSPARVFVPKVECVMQH